MNIAIVLAVIPNDESIIVGAASTVDETIKLVETTGKSIVDCNCDKMLLELENTWDVFGSLYSSQNDDGEFIKIERHTL